MHAASPPAASPTQIAHLLDEAASLLAEGENAQAASLVDRALVLDPVSPRALALQGRTLAMLGRLDDAAQAYAHAVALKPDDAGLRHDMAIVLEAQGRRDLALETLRTGIAAATACPPPVHRLHVRLLVAAADWPAALAAAAAGLAELPGDPELVVLQGAILRRLGRPEAALAAQDDLLATVPDCVPALCEKGWSLLALGRHEAAMAAFDLALDGDDPPASALLGMAQAEVELGMHTAALAAYGQLLEREPTNYASLFGRAALLQAMRRFPEAAAAYDELLRQAPHAAEAYDNLGSMARDLGDLDAAVRHHRQALEIEPGLAVAHSNLLLTLLYQPGQTPESLAREHAAWGVRHGAPAGRFTAWPNDRAPDRKLRLGFVSGEFRKHALSAWLMTPLAALDRTAFDIFCYMTQRGRDEVTVAFEALADGWRDVVPLSDQAMAERIRADGIDILIDISGHTGANRLPVFALKPAPIQVSWLGYPFTTGLPAIDYFIMDAVAVRPDEEAMFTEQVVRLPGGRFCYEPPSTAPAVVPPPALTNGWVTFGSFNNLTKLTPEVLDVWFRIIERLPTARLILKTPALADRVAAERLRAAFCDRGLTSARLELRTGSSQSELLAQYGDIDIALDPFPFGGGITSCEALWMGVPLITMPGWQPVSRQSETILRAIGRNEWIARDTEDYLRIAVELARDPLRLADLRAMQREALRSSPVCDQARIGRELGEAFRRMWHSFVTRDGSTTTP